MSERGLPENYFRYPRRGRRLDHDWFGRRLMHDATPFAWPGGKKLAVWIGMTLEHFPIDMSGLPFMPTGGMVRPAPSYWDYTQRDYGNRIGAYRLFEAFDAHAIRPDIIANLAALERHPALTAELDRRGLDVIAGGLDMTCLHHADLPEAAERAMISDCLDGLHALTGKRPRGWLGPGQSVSPRTFALLAEAGVDHALDLNNDELPYDIAVPFGRLSSLPVNYELSDRRIMVELGQSAACYRAQIEAACARLAREATPQAPRLLMVMLSPWVSGQPFRIAEIEALLATLAAEAEAVFLGAGAIMDASRNPFA
ncbi:hypothetical protein NFI95_10765 [Acetobacteraceae bacterium KSS8]|uniref:Uroporphyrinogen decarboxylase (URO-D) domain-containing protein n=1 Tax=Endosaccharibacter trunci TaxID=2812733 RepID=A0ABT1W9K9_9PROT|nr:hypothetical protein [Acetobacteraceae bacterium KSS8]